MKNIRILLQVLLLSFVVYQAHGQYYDEQINHMHLEGMYSSDLESGAAELSTEIETGDPNTEFKVLSYSLMPSLAAVDEDCFQHSLNYVYEDLETKSNYLAIIKTIESDGEKDNIRKYIKFYIKYSLPNTTTFDTISSLLLEGMNEKLTRIAGEMYGLTSNVIAVEVSIMKTLNEGIVNGNYETGEALEELGFQKVSFEGFELRGKVSDNFKEDNTSGDRFTGAHVEDIEIEIKAEASNDWLNLTQLHDGNVDVNGNTINYFINNSAFLHRMTEEEIRQKMIDENLQCAIQNYVEFLSYPGMGNFSTISGYYYKTYLNLDHATIDDILGKELLADLSYQGITADGILPPGYSPPTGAFTGGDGASRNTPAWAEYGKNIVVNGGLDVSSPKAVACGILDGFLATCATITSLGTAIKSIYTLNQAEAEELVRKAVKKESLKEVSDYSLIKTYQNFKELINNLNVGNILDSIQGAISDFFKGLLEGDNLVYYGMGILLFEVIFELAATVVSGGIGLAKFLGRIVKDGAEGFKNLFTKYVGDYKHKRLSARSKTKGTKCEIILGGCFVKDTPVLMASNPFKNVATGMALAAMPLVAPIQDVQVDDMVKAYHHEDMYLTASNDADDIYVPDWQDYDYLDITPETWQVGKFVITEENGSLVEIEANRPKKWFDDYELKEKGDKAFIVIEEMGIANYAILQDIRSTDIDTRDFELNKSGKVDRPVITTYKRIAHETSDYAFSNGQIISCTPNHPFYSSDRQAYFPIEEMTFGETVQTAGERVVKFIGGKSRDKGEHVYNFEVWREHNYYVGSEGINSWLLVHNSCAKKILGDSEYITRKNHYKAQGYSAKEAEELVEKEALSSGLIDEALESGEYVVKGLADEIRQEAKAFAEDMALELLIQVASPGASVEQEVTLDIELESGETYTIRADHVVNDGGELHIGEAKYSRKDKNWDLDYKMASTSNQKKFFNALDPSKQNIKLKSITPRGNSKKLQALGLTHGVSFSPLKIKSYRIFGSTAGSSALSKTIKLLF